jgi:hypothetical protein
VREGRWFALAQVPAKVQSFGFEVAKAYVARVICQPTVARRPPLMERQAARSPTFHPAGKLGGVKTWPKLIDSCDAAAATETETAHKRATRPGPVLHEIFVVAGVLVR